MIEWEGKIHAPRLTCSVSNRPLLPGELFFSGLVVQDNGFARRDFCTEIWNTYDKSQFISWWRQKIPSDQTQRKVFKLNAETLIQLFTNLKESRSRAQQCLAYVVALALVRARKLQLLEVITHPDAVTLLINDKSKALVYRIRDPEMTADEQAHVLNNLLQVIGDVSASLSTAPLILTAQIKPS